VLFMLRALCLAMTLVVVPGPASADAGPEPGANAALKYWQAFATLPKFTDAEGQKLNAECLTMPLDAQARDLVTKADYALQLMRRGAALRHCDWGVSYEDGVYVRLPHGPAARMVSCLACLRARLRFEEGRSAEAVEDLVAAMTLGRHISQTGTFIMLLVGYAIEHRAGEALALHLPKLNAEAVKDLKTRLGALPPAMSLAAALDSEEKCYLDWFVRKVKEAKDKESLLALLTPLVGREPEGKARNAEEKGRAFLQECGGTAEGVLKFAEETRPSYALLAKKLDLPPEQFEKELEREKGKRAGNPVFNVFFPALQNVRRQQARVEVRRALLAAALAVQLDGRDALKKHPDPVVGGPFDYVAFPGGFELRSKLKGTDGKPVALTVGRRGT
jgi:hypothetical protein